MVERVVVVAAGARGPLPDLDGAFVVAADGGADAALALGLHVDLAIGDFDSISAAGLAALERAGTRIERHPAAKDATDLELALDAALAAEPRRSSSSAQRAGGSTTCSRRSSCLGAPATRTSSSMRSSAPLACT